MENASSPALTAPLTKNGPGADAAAMAVAQPTVAATRTTTATAWARNHGSIDSRGLLMTSRNPSDDHMMRMIRKKLLVTLSGPLNMPTTRKNRAAPAM